MARTKMRRNYLSLSVVEGRVRSDAGSASAVDGVPRDSLDPDDRTQLARPTRRSDAVAAPPLDDIATTFRCEPQFES